MTTQGPWQQAAPASFFERAALAAILVLIALLSHVLALRAKVPDIGP